MSDGLVTTGNGSDFFDLLKYLAEAGVPIFSDPRKLRVRIFCAMYYAVKAEVPESIVIFPNDVLTPLNIIWIVEHYDMVGRSGNFSFIQTIYERGKDDKTNNRSTITVSPDSYMLGLLNPEEIRKRWEIMQKILPRGEFDSYKPDFDIVKWYSSPSLL